MQPVAFLCECPFCGAPLSVRGAFCPHCGSRLLLAQGHSHSPGPSADNPPAHSALSVPAFRSSPPPFANLNQVADPSYSPNHSHSHSHSHSHNRIRSPVAPANARPPVKQVAWDPRLVTSRAETQRQIQTQTQKQGQGQGQEEPFGRQTEINTAANTRAQPFTPALLRSHPRSHVYAAMSLHRAESHPGGTRVATYAEGQYHHHHHHHHHHQQQSLRPLSDQQVPPEQPQKTCSEMAFVALKGFLVIFIAALTCRPCIQGEWPQ